MKTSNVINIVKQYAPEVMTDWNVNLYKKQLENEKLYSEKEMYIPEPEWYVHTKLYEEELDASLDEELDNNNPVACIPSSDINPAYMDEMPGFTFNRDKDLETQSSNSLENPLYVTEGIDVEALHFVLSMHNKDTTKEISDDELALYNEPVMPVEKKPYFKTVDIEHNDKDRYTIIHKSNGQECYDEIEYHDNIYTPSVYSQHQSALMKAKVKLKQLRADEKLRRAKGNEARATKDYDAVRRYNKMFLQTTAQRRKISELLDKYNKLNESTPLKRWTKRVEEYLPKFVSRQQRMLKKADDKSMQLLSTFDRAGSAIRACWVRPVTK